MKRPEGFDAPSTAHAATREKPSRAKKPEPAQKTERAPKPERAQKTERAPKPERAPKAPRPSAPRVASAELRAAARARKRHDKHELRRFTRRARRRRLAWAVSLGLLVTLVGLSFAAVYSPLLALREITIDGTVRLDPAQLDDAIDGQLGVPLALLDEGRLRKELGAFSLIRSYTTEIVPPGTLLIHITERAPVGTIARDGAFDLVDPAGVVIATTPERQSGVPLIEVTDDDVEGAAFTSVAEVLLALPPEFLAQVDTVRATTRDDVTLVLTGSNQRVEWGSKDDSDHKARVLAALLAIHSASGPGLYDVSAPGSAVFRAD